MSEMLLVFSLGVMAGIVLGILMCTSKQTLCCVLSTLISSGMALATGILCKQQKVGEHHAQC